MCSVANEKIADAMEKVGKNYIIRQPDINRLIFPASSGVYVQCCQRHDCRRNEEGQRELQHGQYQVGLRIYFSSILGKDPDPDIFSRSGSKKALIRTQFLRLCPPISLDGNHD